MEDRVAGIRARMDQLSERYLQAGAAERIRLILEYMRLKEERERIRSGG